MKRLLNNIILKNMKWTISLLLGLCLFSSGCKKTNDGDISSTLIEAKLTNRDYQQWYVPFVLSDTKSCNLDNSASLLVLYTADHAFKYLHAGCPTITGTWSLACEVNHTGQKIRIDFYASTGKYDGIDLKYSSESDTFYTLDDGTLGLKAFKKDTSTP